MKLKNIVGLISAIGLMLVSCSKESMEKKKLRKHRKMKLQVKKKLLYFMKIMTSLSFSIQLNQKLHIYSKWKQTVK